MKRNSVRKTIAFLLVLVTLLSVFSGCGGSVVPEDPEETEENVVTDENGETQQSTGKQDTEATDNTGKKDTGNADGKSLLAAIETGNFTLASELWNSGISDDTVQSAIVKAGLESSFGVVLAAFGRGDIDQKTVEDGLNVIKGFGLISTVELQTQMKQVFDSKTNYATGVALFEAGIFADAYSYLKKVVVTDADYADAVAKLKVCADTIREQAKQDYEGYMAQQNYTKAKKTLQDTKAVLGEDDVINALMTQLDAVFIQNSLAQAKAAFEAGENGKDALSAMTVLKLAINELGYAEPPEELAEALAEYETYVPVNLVDMESLSGFELVTFDFTNAIDCRSNSYKNGMFIRHSSGNQFDVRETYGQYYLAYQYTTFSGVVCCSEWYKGTTEERHVTVIGDGIELWHSNSMNGTSAPQEFSIDVSGVEYLEIRWTAGTGAEFSIATIYEGVFQK